MIVGMDLLRLGTSPEFGPFRLQLLPILSKLGLDLWRILEVRMPREDALSRGFTRVIAQGAVGAA